MRSPSRDYGFVHEFKLPLLIPLASQAILACISLARYAALVSTGVLPQGSVVAQGLGDINKEEATLCVVNESKKSSR
uniref:Secreted protein n=1 Tax=Steinernema glaseri TaxID=37863 RepID=A0A1I8AEN8_9BILA